MRPTTARPPRTGSVGQRQPHELVDDPREGDTMREVAERTRDELDDDLREREERRDEEWFRKVFVCKYCKDFQRQSGGRTGTIITITEDQRPKTAARRLRTTPSGRSWMNRWLTPMSRAKKRIPVTEDRWKELNELKSAGETYDELLQELIREHNRRQLADRVRAVREADEEELTPLDEL